MFAKLKSKFATTYDVFGNRSFLFSGWSLSLFGMAKALRTTIMGWYIYQETNDPTQLGLIALIEALPYILSNPLSGYMADRIGRRKPVIWMSVCIFLLALHLSWLVGQPFSKSILMGIYINFALSGLARGLLGSGAIASIIAFVVPRHQFQKASAWNGIFVKAGMIAGPILGGLLYKNYGIVMASNFVTGMMVLIFIMMQFVKDVPLAQKEEGMSEWQSLTAGFRFVFSHETLKATILLDFIALVFSGVTGLLPVFAKDILHLGPDGLGWLKSSLQAGAIFAGFVLSHRQIKNFAGRQFVRAEIFCSLFLLAFAFSTSFPLSIALLFLSGFCDNASTVIRHTITRLLTPNNVLGRVTAVRALFSVTATEMSTFESGLVAGAIGTIPSVVFGVAVTLLSAGWIWWKAPSVKSIHMKDLVLEE